jgi:manganese efflux pump family protein
MGIAALVLWILTAGGGGFMLAKWVGGGGHRQPRGHGFPPAVVFGHFLLAAAGLVLWIVYLAVDNDPFGWVALILLAPVAILGLMMLARWVPIYRGTAPARVTSSAGAPVTEGAVAERSLPVAVVAAHGVLAVVTVVLVLLTMLGIGTGPS